MFLLFLLAAQPMEPSVRPVPPPPLIRVPVVSAPVVDRTQPSPELFDRAVPARSVQPLASYVTSDDYPALAIRAGEQGLVEFALRVGADGRPAGCSVLNQSRSVALEVATCQLLTSRARFEPARDKSGQAVEAAVRGRIKWVLPPAPPMPERMAMRHRIRADGSASDCVMETVIGGEITRRQATICENLQTPAAILAAIRGQSALPEPYVLTEMRLLKSASEPWPDFKESGARVLARSYARLVVEEDGRVSRCTVIESSSIIGRSPNPCRPTMTLNPKGLSLPSELRVVMAVMLEKEPAGE